MLKNEYLCPLHCLLENLVIGYNCGKYIFTLYHDTVCLPNNYCNIFMKVAIAGLLYMGAGSEFFDIL